MGSANRFLALVSFVSARYVGLNVAIAVLLASAATGTASAAQMKLPDCAGLTAWGKSVDAHQTYSVAPRLAVPKALEEPHFSALFGLPALDWTRPDFIASKKALTACYRQARKRRDHASAGALGIAGRTLTRRLPRVITKLERGERAAEKAKKAVDALPDSAALSQALAVLLQADPAAPDMHPLHGLPRGVARAVYNLARTLPWLANSERATMFKALAARRTRIQAALTASAKQAIVAAPADADGIIALMQQRRELDQIADTGTRNELARQAGERIVAARTALHQARPSVWVPPDCLGLYRWANAPGAAQGETLGRTSIRGLFADDHTVPVFGISLADWSDADLARYRKLSDFCRGDMRALQRRAPKDLTPAQTALLKARGNGDWALDPSHQVDFSNTRKTLLDHRNALGKVRQMTARIAALPATDATLVQMGRMRSEPALGLLSPREAAGFASAYNAKLTAVGAHQADAAIKGLADIDVRTLEDLAKLQGYATQATRTISRTQDRSRFSVAYERTMREAALKLLPRFQDKMNAIPATPEGVMQADTAVAKLTGIRDQDRVAGLAPLRSAADKRLEAIVKTLRQQACDDLLSSIGARSDAAQPVWNGDQGMPLGRLFCGLAEHGIMISAYSGSGLFSSTASFKLNMPGAALQTYSMHTAEVLPGKKMLVGFAMKDANRDHKLTVEEWAQFTRLADNRVPMDTQGCKQFLDMAPGQEVPANAKPYRLQCALQSASMGNRGR